MRKAPQRYAFKYQPKFLLMRPIAYYSTPKHIARFMASLLPSDRGISILDAGCGRGEFLFILRELGYRNVTGIEIYKPFADYCRKMFPEYRIINGDFLRHRGRYDAIIGNPPYIKLSELPRDLMEEAVRIIGCTQGNLYYAFILKAVELLRDRGVLVFIVPSSLRGNTYARVVRERLLRSGSITRAYIFMDEDLFADASQNVMIFRFEKGVWNPIVTVSNIDGSTQNLREISVRVMRQWEFMGARADLVAKRWRTVSDLSLGIHVGLASGCDACFKAPEALIARMDEIELTYVREFVTSRDCGPYSIRGTTKYLFLNSIKNEGDLRRLANIYSWLRRHENRLRNRYLPKGVMWWHWQATRNIGVFDRFRDDYKIFFPSITRRPVFSISRRHIYPSSSVSVLIPRRGYEFLLLAYLNSAAFRDLYSRLGFMNGGRYVLKSSIVGSVPVPELPEEDIKEVDGISRRLVEKYDHDTARKVDEIFSNALDKIYKRRVTIDEYIRDRGQSTIDSFLRRR